MAKTIKCPKCGATDTLSVTRQMTYKNVSGFYKITECDECGERLKIEPLGETKAQFEKKARKSQKKLVN